ncbi:DUF4350 domain-containing protein [Metapseudomonas resinovorans]|uniref:DUF4350 domain-containing protein n=1 Tax=Metapseudomonas resinovorans NBRC 106553 TaxID=1245471 RepID=S6BD40_METRE|nr:DUF4350 domain-containing protein [Pseudomonas resinovorans]BAN46939.1 hypothetical protein PCA10_12070 [Pseudomonas resinovorans NBRC 106553]
MIVRPRVLLGAGLLLLLGLLAIYLGGRLLPYQDSVEHGPAPEVLGNPYLAAEHFLRKRGLAVTRADGLEVLDKLPSAGHSLLLLGSRSRMTPRQADRLLQWASKGGHLLFIAERLYDEKVGESGDLLADRLGIQQYETRDLDKGSDKAAEPDGEQPEEAADSDQARAEEDPFPELTKLYLENEQAPAYASFDPDFHLFDSQNRAHAWANSAKATHMLQLNHGDGLVTVLTDGWIWQNRDINEYDNAWLLWYLTQDSDVTLLYRAERDSLASLLGENFAEALVALALLIVLLLWHVGQRQGPLQAPASRSRRQLEEHLRGSADFLLRRSGQASLLQGLQRDIQRRARHRHPGFERLPVAEQWQALGRLTRLPPSAISQAMRPLPRQRLNAADFTRQVAHLQTLRNAL